jgi:glycosyltransferase involved in cell wall biosynthesis
VGCIDSRFDAPLYEHLAKKRPEWNFVIVGPLTGKPSATVSRLKEMANVHFLGPRERSDLPAYLKYFDVCTIPYVCNTLSQSIFPLKFFEYLSAGRPVVSTNLPELLPYNRYVHVAQTPDAFENALEQSLQHPLPAASESFLNQNSWGAKAEAMWETLQQAITVSRNGE